MLMSEHPHHIVLLQQQLIDRIKNAFFREVLNERSMPPKSLVYRPQ